MQVSFLESTIEKDFDVVVIVSTEKNKDFIDKKIRSLTGFETPKAILDSCSGLKYKDTKKFDLVFGEKILKLIVACAGNKTDRASAEKLGGYVFDQIDSKNAKVCVLNNVESEFQNFAAYFASGISLKSWTFDKYKTNKKEPKIESIKCTTCYIESNQNIFEKLDNIKDAVFSVRELVTEPANVMTPDQMLIEAQNLKKFGIKVSFLDKKDMEKLGMNALLGVSKGSDQPAYTIIMEYKTDKDKDLIALVGKGLTFDSGGICLKPAKGMGDMKGDMTGAAVVIGAMKALALNEAKANVVGLIGVVENMISGSAQKPGDVVQAMSKTTIEVDNTDAEGRLVLADVLTYASEKFSPKVIVDFATLTGAIQIALGHEFAGLFSNSDELSNMLEKSGSYVGEKLWRFPLHPSYEDDIKSDIADIKNCGSGRGAGSITAALFLKHFVPDSVKWAHIDIAATEWDTRNRALSQKGATGFGVRLIEDFVSRYYDSAK